MSLCECGCGEAVKRRFVRGHNVRVTGSPAKRGRDHHRWNGDKIESSHGYSKVRVGTSHPLADPNGYAYEHLVVWVSAGNPRPSRGEVLHHINGNRADNRLDNLELCNRGRHIMLHHSSRDAESGRLVSKKAAGRLLDGREHDEVPDVG